MRVEPDYNAPIKTKIAVLASTGVTSGLYVAYMMKSRKIKRLHQLEMSIKDGINLCTASTLGGLGAGLIVDKPEHRKAKLKDSVNQLVGNTFIPFGCLALANKCTKKLPKPIQTIVAIGTLIGTTFLGHAVANKTNKKIFKEDSNYKCNMKDFICDFDDMFFASSTVLKSKWLYMFTASVCPVTYLIHGYLSGTRQKDKKVLDKKV